jgi:hypothetical protein
LTELANHLIVIVLPGTTAVHGRRPVLDAKRARFGTGMVRFLPKPTQTRSKRTVAILQAHRFVLRLNPHPIRAKKHTLEISEYSLLLELSAIRVIEGPTS